MANFSITPGMGQGEIVAAINYLLANIGQGIQVNAGTGLVTIPNQSQDAYAWAYRYLYLAFADSSDGTQGFNQTPQPGQSYIGFLNTNTEQPGGSIVPKDYTWFKLQYPFVSGTLIYQTLSLYQFKFYTDSDPNYNFFTPTSTLPPYDWRTYQGEAGGSQVGVDLEVLTNATTIAYGTLSSPPNMIYGMYPSGNTPEFKVTQDIDVGYLSTVHTDFTTGTYKVGIFKEYQPSLKVSYQDFGNPPAGLSFTYDYNNTTSNTLNAANLLVSHNVTMLPQSVAPTNITTGTLATADRVNWDPAGLGINTAYPVFYDGTQWQAMYRPAIYGSFSSTSTFTVTTATNSYVFTYNHTDFQQGIQIVNTATSRIQLDGAGIYDLQFSVQCSNSAAGLHNAYIWLRQNGQDVVRSAGDITIPGKHGSVNGSTIASWNYYIQTTATNEYVELVYGAEDIAVSFPTYAAGTGPTRPQSPAIIVTVEKVS